MILSVALKEGVDIRKLTAPALLGFFVIAKVFEDHGIPCVLTSGDEGVHVPNSKHYSGNGLDIRLPSRYASSPNIDEKIVSEIKSALNAPKTFDVILETTHIHCEFDPKDPIA